VEANLNASLINFVKIPLRSSLMGLWGKSQVFGVTKDPLIVWTSNMAAIMSLRALYSFVSTVLQDLQYLDKAVALILAWVSLKLVAEYFGAEINTYASLAIVLSLLGGGIGASLLFPEEQKKSS
jgi:predicted tellurium resistance membrane protein TerC